MFVYFDVDATANTHTDKKCVADFCYVLHQNDIVRQTNESIWLHWIVAVIERDQLIAEIFKILSSSIIEQSIKMPDQKNIEEPHHATKYIRPFFSLVYVCVAVSHWNCCQ